MKQVTCESCGREFRPTPAQVRELDLTCRECERHETPIVEEDSDAQIDADLEDLEREIWSNWPEELDLEIPAPETPQPEEEDDYYLPPFDEEELAGGTIFFQIVVR